MNKAELIELTDHLQKQIERDSNKHDLKVTVNKEVLLKLLSLLQQQEQPESEVIVEKPSFSEWLQNERWFYFDKSINKWKYTFENGTSISKEEYAQHYTKSTHELYFKFLSEQPTKPVSEVNPKSENEMIAFLLVNAIKNLSNDNKKVLADSIYERLPTKPVKSAQEILKKHLTIDAMRINNPDYTFNKVIEAMQEYRNQLVNDRMM